MAANENTHEMPAAAQPPEPEVAFGSNDVRLTWRQWLAVAAVVGVVLAGLPTAWPRLERIDSAANYRIPSRMSEDYWLFRRLCRRARQRGQVLVVGDSVIWGPYVAQDESLPAALNVLAGREGFANLGVDGMHPAALAGLIEHYGQELSRAKVLLHCNLLWMSSKRHDLQTRKEMAFNHPSLVPQFGPLIPCYRESFSNRLAIVVRRASPVEAWARHVALTYFDGNDVPTWSVGHPLDNPLGRITLEVPSGAKAETPPADAVAWTKRGIHKLDAPWVPLGESFQWRRFRRAVERLRERGSEVFVLVGPFNEHMLTDESLAAYTLRKREAAAWLRSRNVACYVPDALPSEYYADASHPLAVGYALLAKRMMGEAAFARFVAAAGNNRK